MIQQFNSQVDMIPNPTPLKEVKTYVIQKHVCKYL